MCGIVGAIAIEPLALLDDEARVAAAIDCLAHRGPDDRGLLVAADRRAFLGHRRLSIIDLAGGRQPISDESGRVHLVCNGEVYNYRALGAELVGRGHVFRTRADGEPALHLYQDRPDDFERALSGMFAIAILDEPRRRLTLVRDRNGIKPLYYHSDGRRLIFASEIKAILTCLGSTPPICPAALRDYLHWKYVPAPRTLYQGICELPAGVRLTATPDADGRGLSIDVREYWSPTFEPKLDLSEEDAVEQLDQRLRAVVESHLVADVELGALLSGGVDSSLVVALASRLAGRRLKTFSVGFREPGFDQLPFARTLAAACGTEHHEEYVEIDPLAALPRLVRHFDQPFGDSSALACFHVCEVAARHVKVVLTGDGGDETFAGYRRYADLNAWAAGDRAWKRVLRRAALAAAAALVSPEARFLAKLRAGVHPASERYLVQERLCSDWLLERLLGPAYRRTPGLDGDPVDALRREALARGWPVVDAAQFVDLRTYLPGDILAKVDRTSMACSLECRVPLLDHTVTEFGAALPFELKVRDGQAKRLLKRVAERYVPRALIYRKKRGFRVPIRRWFKRGLLERSEPLLLGGVLVERGVLDAAGVRWVLRRQRRPWMNLASCLWALLFMEFWARGAFDGGAPPRRDG